MYNFTSNKIILLTDICSIFRIFCSTIKSFRNGGYPFGVCFERLFDWLVAQNDSSLFLEIGDDCSSKFHVHQLLVVMLLKLI